MTFLASSTASSDLTGKACSPNTIQWVNDVWATGILLAFLALFPLFSRYRLGDFEAGRWRNAGYSLSGSSDSTEGDSGDND
mgnify:CR=1 FL=1